MGRILVVDDEMAIRLLLARYLTGCGHEVAVAASGGEAMAMLHESPVDLLITDINMPDMDGIELLIQMHKSSHTIPVIVVSGGGLIDKKSLLSSARSLAASATIEKPFDLAALKATVERLLSASSNPQ